MSLTKLRQKNTFVGGIANAAAEPPDKKNSFLNQLSKEGIDDGGRQTIINYVLTNISPTDINALTNDTKSALLNSLLSANPDIASSPTSGKIDEGSIQNNLRAHILAPVIQANDKFMADPNNVALTSIIEINNGIVSLLSTIPGAGSGPEAVKAAVKAVLTPPVNVGDFVLNHQVYQHLLEQVPSEKYHGFDAATETKNGKKYKDIKNMSTDNFLIGFYGFDIFTFQDDGEIKMNNADGKSTTLLVKYSHDGAYADLYDTDGTTVKETVTL